MRGAVIRVAVLASLALSCGGGPTAPPPPRFPDVNGAYSFLATFDGFASQQVNSSGSVTFQQVDPNAAPLIASANVAARFPGPKCSRCELDAHCDPVQHFACEGYVDGLSRCGDPTRPFDTCPSGAGELDARPFVATFISSAAMADGGRISFRLGSQSALWQFDGTVSADGRSMSGTHTFGVALNTPIAGRWTASR